MSDSPCAHYTDQAPIGLYIHVPFCARKCPYCDFNTYAGLGSLQEETVGALCSELAVWGARLARRKIASVFVGGGTPTILSHRQLSELFQRVHASFSLDDGCEISVEANPGTVDRDKFRLLRTLGANRLSIGVQSLQQDELRFLGRIHDVDDVYTAFESGRDAGFDNINLDFIFGLPDQHRDNWLDTLQQAGALEPEHLSLYSLIVEPDTPLFRWVEEGLVHEPDEDNAAELYELATDRLSASGYEKYEVSNWARDDEAQRTRSTMPRRACRHNLLYWRNQEYVGIGPGAHSHLRARDETGKAISRRWSNVRAVPAYVRRAGASLPLEDFSEEIDARSSMGETMMLGLRLVEEGVAYRRFEKLHGAKLTEVFNSELLALDRQGLIVNDADRVRLSRRGLMIGNQVFSAFLSESDNAQAA